MGFVGCEADGMMVIEVMTCREVTGFLDEYLAGALEEEQHAAIEEHLRECEDCRRYLDSYRRTIALGKHAEMGEENAAPLELPASLRRAISEARKGKK
jgi:predicted anti-sigma-YlaC factor YlaD